MSKIIDITSKLSNEKITIKIGNKKYPINDGMEVVLKFEELVSAPTMDNMIKAVEISLGEEAVNEIDIKKMNIKNFKVLTTGILAAMQDMTYEEAVSRFQQPGEK